MDTKVAYEVVDMREGVERLERIGIVKLVPEGMNVWTPSRSLPEFLEWDDDSDEAFQYDADAGSLMLITEHGRIMFQKITASSWEDLAPFFEADFAVGETSAKLNQAIYSRILGAF